MCGMKSSAILVAVAALAPWAAGAVEVAGTSLTVTLDEQAKGAVTRLVTAHGAELAPAQGATALFRLKLTRTDDFTKSVSVTADDAETCALEAGAAGAARLVYGGFKEGVVFVACMAQGGDAYVRWRISVQTAPGWALEATEYPRLLVAPVLGGDGGDDRLVYGATKGGVVYNPGAKPAGWRVGAQQPGALAAQFATVYDDRAGLYFATEDAAGHTKYIGAARRDGGLVVYSTRIGFDEGSVAQAYDVVTGGFEGTHADPCSWHDAADLYKAWAVKQKWCEKTFENRDDVPAWMRDAPAMVRFGREWIEQSDKIRAWMQDSWRRTFVPSPLVVAFRGWEKHGYLVSPDCFPVHGGNEAFAELVSGLYAEGAHTFVSPAGYQWARMCGKQENGAFEWDDRERFERIGHPHAVSGRDGTRYLRTPSWLHGGDCAYLCGGDPWTRKWWNDYLCSPLAMLGCEVIQVGQMQGGRSPACWNRNHAHQPGDGKWKTDAFLDQLATMRETMRTNGVPDAVVCVEEPNENYSHLVGIQDYRDCESGADEWASVFNYLYHEYIPCFQSSPRRANRIWQAHAAADGQIPVLLPSLSGPVDGPAAYNDFMRRWVAYYHGEGRAWLAFGRQVKPPRVVCASQPYKATLPGGRKVAGRRPTVFCNAYVASDGRKAIVLVNATAKPQPVALYKGGKRVSLVLDADEIRLLK